MRLLIAVALFSSMLGCNGNEKEKEADSDVTLKGNKSDGDSTGQNSSSTDSKNTPSNKPPVVNSKKVLGKPIPEDFPKDIPIDTDMPCVSVTKIKENFMVTFHTKKSMSEVTDWFKTKLGEHGWEASGTPAITKTSAILAYKKQDRTCGISVTGFILDASAQKDETMRGITIQTKATP